MWIKRTIKNLINSILGAFDIEIRRKGQACKKRTHGRCSLEAPLKQVKKTGFSPAVVIDVGVADGTAPLYEMFPEAKFILIEPLEEYRPFLDGIVGALGDAEYLIAAAAGETGSVTVNVHPDLVGSSMYLECEDTDVNGVLRTVPAVRLDEVCAERGLEGPYLIKIDVQGAELDVLAGADRILEDTEYVLLEVSLFGFFVDGPQFYDVVSFMKDRGFVAYDIIGHNYRPLDGALAQVDMVFVKETGRPTRAPAWILEPLKQRW